METKDSRPHSMTQSSRQIQIFQLLLLLLREIENIFHYFGRFISTPGEGKSNKTD